MFSRFLKSKPTITWSKIEPLQSESIKPFFELEAPQNEMIKEQLNKLIVVKLNGGLGTSMGCKGPKSLIAVRHDLTFIDIVMQQIQHLNITYGVDIPLVLMNSFSTDEDTKRILRKYRNVKVSVYSFNQSRYPRIDKETLMPIIRTLSAAHSSWYPPGHGNFYESFHASGLLDTFLADGKEFCFVSNIDNLGATVDLSRFLNILNFLCNHPQNDFIMELTDKTRADIKGGTLINYDGRLRLLELAQVSKDHYDDFTSVIVIFNKAFRTIGTTLMDLEIIVNHKHLSNLGLNVIQLESAAGAAVKNFQGSIGEEL
ncbi:unnamed protein product [Soboliphyme baturini]|uniref:UTP--glucose-1-phosphate uridylyltransferase n=1 Tax=Soboliphyme baturini TaxID=241478 RepID=A0A183J0V6_9BILA|nr:unnamed protein product [Soboliphyme baturini]